mmetsp:Transcript_33361/g.41024  ORF Transcript_33361/g.41024 Transcript_33361/m.41024 type:complete len:263 (-) Transcript_33361:176-964(-)
MNDFEMDKKEVLCGIDDSDYEYSDSDEYWDTIDDRVWYKKVDVYWKNFKPNIKDMLGGMQQKIHKIDVETSIKLVKQYCDIKCMKHCKKKDKNINVRYALDCGAGIGRVTQYVLGPMFDKVDICEINKSFCKEYIKRHNKSSFYGNVYNKSLHNFIPTKNKYNCIWFQWVVEHLTDNDLINLLKNCKLALKRNEKSVIILKENTCRTHYFYANKHESSMIRHELLLYKIFKKAGLNVLFVTLQEGFPSDLYPQKIYVLSNAD